MNIDIYFTLVTILIRVKLSIQAIYRSIRTQPGI